MKIEAIKEFTARYSYFDESKALHEFFRDLPDDLDLDSAKYYLRKEFKEQSAGYDKSSFEYPRDDYDYGRQDLYDMLSPAYSYEELVDLTDEDLHDLAYRMGYLDAEYEEVWCDLCGEWETRI